MAEARDPDSEHSPYMRLPWPVVAVGLFVVLAVVLGFGLWANQNYRSRVEAPPTQVPSAAVAISTLAAPVLTAGTAATPAFTPVPLTAVATATPAATAIPSVPPATTPAGASGTPTARPTVDPIAAAEVSQAYDRYWQVRAQALLSLDKVHLADAMAGDHLNSIAQRIDELRLEHRAIRTDVDHESRVVTITGDDAQVVDDYISNSIYVDPVTQQPLSEPTADELQVLYTLSKAGGTWRVVDSVRAE
jgi:hypothetical protein